LVVALAAIVLVLPMVDLITQTAVAVVTTAA
jgi:hypothetical protein